MNSIEMKSTTNATRQQDRATRRANAAAFEGAAGGKPLEIFPIATTMDYMDIAKSVGEATTYVEALQLVRNAGWRVMHRGGLHTVDPACDSRKFLITVHPRRR